jgi:hypothetical protein
MIDCLFPFRDQLIVPELRVFSSDAIQCVISPFDVAARDLHPLQKLVSVGNHIICAHQDVSVLTLTGWAREKVDYQN